MQIDLLGILNSLWQVLVVGLLLGAGLPALFAVGIRALGGTRRASGPVGYVGPDGPPAAAPTAAGRFVAWLCFGLCLAVAAFGMVVIVFGKQMFG